MLLSLLVALVALVLVPSRSYAGFTTPLSLSLDLSSPYAYSPEAAMDAAGNTHLIYTDYDAVDGDVLVYRRISAGGIAAAPVFVVTDAVDDPRIAVDTSGIAHVIWFQGSSIFYARVLSDGTVVTPAPELAVALPSSSRQTMRIAVDAGGGTHVVWATPIPDPDTSAVDGYYRYIAPNGIPAATVTLTPQVRSSSSVTVAGGAAGVGYIAWNDMAGGEAQVATATNGVLGASSSLSGGEMGLVPRVAVDGAGNVHYAWIEEAGPSAVVRYVRSVDGVLGATQDVGPSATGTSTSVLALAVDAAGIAHVMWDESARAKYASVTNGTVVSAAAFVTPFSPGGDWVNDLVVAGGAAGQVFAVWKLEAATDRIQAVRIVNGVPGSIVDLPTFNNLNDPFVVANSAGQAGIGWRDNENLLFASYVEPPSCSNATATVQQGASVSVNVSCTGSPTSVAIDSAPTSGTVGAVNAAAGTIQYTAAASFVGAATFTFTATNAGGASTAKTATITVTAPATTTPPPATCPAGQTGTPPSCVTSPLILTGGSTNQTFRGGAANDVFRGGTGSETFFSSGGNDRASGGAGNDRLYGSWGNDIFSGGIGNDRIFGGAGNDTLRGDAGNDIVDGGKGIDDTRGGSGNDRVTCGAGGKETAHGDAGSDIVSCIDGLTDDTVNGGTGDDVCFGDVGDRFVGCERIVRVATAKSLLRSLPLL